MYKSDKKGWATKNAEISVISFVDDEKFITGTVKVDLSKYID